MSRPCITPFDLPFVPPDTPGSTSPVRLRGCASAEAARLRQALQQGLAACGCSNLLLRDGETGLGLSFQLRLGGALAVYWWLVESGIAFDPQSHRELTRLCTLEREGLYEAAVERRFSVHLEVRFRPALRRAVRLARIAHA